VRNAEVFPGFVHGDIAVRKLAFITHLFARQRLFLLRIVDITGELAGAAA